MDTLCIPVGEREQSYRLAQIDNMSSIYKGATWGLLLDAELMSISYSRSQPDVHSLLACSIWMTRSWTLQEGKLPSQLAIQFHDCIVVLGRRSARNGEYSQKKIDRPLRMPPELASPERPFIVKLRNFTFRHRNRESIHKGKHGRCSCPVAALERSFFDTFFAVHDSSDMTEHFALVWNELSGRSTTMPEDIPMIITNMLDLKNNAMLDLNDAGKMFQTILLSLKKIPMFIFFNFGPRQDTSTHHHNRWIPTKIGTFGKASVRAPWIVRTRYLECRYSNETKDIGVHVYTANGPVSMSFETYVCLGATHALYSVEPCISSDDQFRISTFHSTWLLIDKLGEGDAVEVLTGACFYVNENPETTKVKTPKNCLVRLWDSIWEGGARKVGDPSVAMTYYCPLRLHKVAADPRAKLIQAQAHTFESLNGTCMLQVKYSMSSVPIAVSSFFDW
jgi:hypothetical protein